MSQTRGPVESLRNACAAHHVLTFPLPCCKGVGRDCWRDDIHRSHYTIPHIAVACSWKQNWKHLTPFRANPSCHSIPYLELQLL